MRWPWGDATWQWRCRVTVGGVSEGVFGVLGVVVGGPSVLVMWPQEYGVAWGGEGTSVFSWWLRGSGAGLNCWHLVLAACVAATSPAAMLLVLLPAWVALCVLQLPLGSTQVRTPHLRWARTQSMGLLWAMGWFWGSATAGEDAGPTWGFPSAPG